MMNNEQKYLLYLIKCAVDEKDAKQPNFEINWSSFAEYAEEQQFEQILYPLFKNNMPAMDSKIWHHLHQRYGRAVVRDTNQDLELERICKTLSEAEIPHIPLKGSVIKKYYPLPEIRYSGDIDILVKETDIERAGAELIKLGYDVEDAGRGIHDSYRNDDFNVELHKNLVNSQNDSFEFCTTVWEHSFKTSEYTFAMSNEFLYIYLLSHLRKHLLFAGGAGIKLILDIYILRKSLKLNNDVLINFCKQASMVNFNQCIVSLEQKWFEGIPCDEINVCTTEQIILNTGAYADYDTYLTMRMSVSEDESFGYAKLKKLFGYLFPTASVLRWKYPVLKKHSYLLPVMWTARFLSAKKNRVNSIISSFKTLNKEKSDVMREYRDYMCD